MNLTMEITKNTQKEFSVFVKKNLANIKYRASYYIPNNKEDKEELIQNTLLKAYLYFNRFDVNRGSFIAWIAYIMRGVFVDNYRKTNKNNKLTDSIEQQNEQGLCSSHFICNNDYESMEYSMQIKEIYLHKISKLSEKDRAIFDFLLEGYKMREIGPLVNMNESSVKARIFRIRAFIKGN